MGVAAPDPTLAPAEVVADLGAGPAVVLLHGVGFGPSTLAPVASALAGRARVLVVRRPPTAPGAALRDQASVTAATVADHLGSKPYLVAGVSGGATLALALAGGGAPVSGVVAHEPLLGSFAPELAGAVRASHAALAEGTMQPAEWFAGLVGVGAWQRLTGERRAEAIVAHADLLAEITPFVEWEPDDAEVAALRRHRILTTVGERSGRARLRAAAAAHRRLGAAVDVLPGAGHLVQFEAPAAFAESIGRLLGARR